MFGSLVIIFPTYHEGGALFLRRHGQRWIVDPGQALADGSLDPPPIYYVAFLNDVEQEVAPVTSGHRVTLTYNLYFDCGGTPVSELDAVSDHFTHPKPSNHDKFNEAFKSLLENPDFMADGGILGFGLRHGYTIESHALEYLYDVLKGSDAVVYQSMRALGFEPVLHMYYDEGWLESPIGVIVDSVIWFGTVYEEGNTISEFAREERKTTIPVRQDDGSIYKSDSGPDPEPIEWVTPMTTYSQKGDAFLTLQDTTVMDWGFGDACMIVRIGKAGDRLVYPTNAEVKKSYEQRGYGPMYC